MAYSSDKYLVLMNVLTVHNEVSLSLVTDVSFWQFQFVLFPGSTKGHRDSRYRFAKLQKKVRDEIIDSLNDSE